MTAVRSACISKNLLKIGEFLCSHFNIEDGRKYARLFGILCFIISRKIKMQLKWKKKICAVCGEGAVTDPTCQKRFAQLEQEQNHRNGDHMEGFQQGSGRGREGGKVQRISSINGR